jgi:hypothetical protein
MDMEARSGFLQGELKNFASMKVLEKEVSIVTQGENIIQVESRDFDKVLQSAKKDESIKINGKDYPVTWIESNFIEVTTDHQIIRIESL